jgi:hypothetical protein
MNLTTSILSVEHSLTAYLIFNDTHTNSVKFAEIYTIKNLGVWGWWWWGKKRIFQNIESRAEKSPIS